MPSHSHHENPFCVFVFPQSLIFYADDPSTHKQILSINNPYAFHLKYKVLSTDTTKYTVSESQGHIKPSNAQDIVVRHKAINAENIGVSDIIRVQLFRSGQSQPIGIKEITVTLQAMKPSEHMSSIFSNPSDLQRFQQLKTEAALSGYLRQGPVEKRDHSDNATRTIFFTIVAVIALLILNLPNDEVRNEGWPSYLHVSIHVKLVSAFVLGCLLTMILRT